MRRTCARFWFALVRLLLILLVVPVSGHRHNHSIHFHEWGGEHDYSFFAGHGTSIPARSITRIERRTNGGRGGPRGPNGRYYYNHPTTRMNATDDSTSGSSGHSGLSFRLKGKQKFYTDLSDVGFCLAVALGWTVWMLSAFIKSDLLRYQKDSVLVRGHVLEVSVADSSLGTGIPTYKAVIDYMVPNESSTSIQVRKHFETQNHLEQGFANVELLVLPQEPTHSVLREDWEKEILEEQQQYQEEVACFRSAAVKRLNVAFAGVLVLATIAGTVHVVTRLSPEQRVWGWILLCVGVALLMPVAICVHRLLEAFHKTMDFDSERAGIIIRGAEHVKSAFRCDNLDVLDVRACDDEPRGRFVCGTAKTVSPSQVISGISQDSVTGAAGADAADCYFVRLPNKTIQAAVGRSATEAPSDEQKMDDEDDDVSSVSSVSVGGYYRQVPVI